MLHTITRLRGVRMVVLLVDRRQLGRDQADPLIAEMQQRFKLPVMLVARDETAWNSVSAIAEFDAVPYLFELLPVRDELEWIEIPAVVEPDLPF